MILRTALAELGRQRIEAACEDVAGGRLRRGAALEQMQRHVVALDDSIVAVRHPAPCAKAEMVGIIGERGIEILNRDFRCCAAKSWRRGLGHGQAPNVCVKACSLTGNARSGDDDSGYRPVGGCGRLRLTLGRRWLHRRRPQTLGLADGLELLLDRLAIVRVGRGFGEKLAPDPFRLGKLAALGQSEAIIEAWGRMAGDVDQCIIWPQTASLPVSQQAPS